MFQSSYIEYRRIIWLKKVKREREDTQYLITTMMSADNNLSDRAMVAQ